MEAFRVAPTAESAEPAVANELTSLLRRWAEGDTDSEQPLFDRVYPEIKRIAVQYLAGRGSEPSIQVTELAHEAFLRLAEQRKVDWMCRNQFFALAATLIRRALVDHFKHRRRLKRGGGVPHLALDEMQIPSVTTAPDLLDLDRALHELAVVSAISARIVELRYFAGMSVEETAEVLGCGRTTVVRKWRFARAWLGRRLEAS